MGNRLLIAVPTTDYIPADFVKSLAKLQQELGRCGIAYDVEIQSGTLVYIARNRLANKAINEKYTHVLWIDSDMVFGEKVYEDLMDVGKEMVCGAFVSRRPPYGPCIYTSIEGDCTTTLYCIVIHKTTIINSTIFKDKECTAIHIC